MAFRRKADFILAQQPDILVVPECEHPDKLKFSANAPLPSDIFWHGANVNKELGIFSYGSHKFTLLETHNADLKNILPIAVMGGKLDFTLFAIWANNPHDKDGQYVTQVWKALHHYEDLLQDTKTMLLGDFNSNTIWDKPLRKGNHSTVVEKLASKGIFSAYHIFHDQIQGQESYPTFYLYRHQDKPYHLDYCFASMDFIKKLTNVEVGNYDDWKHLSDHSPVTMTFDL